MKPDLWINGDFVPWDKAAIHPLCHSLQRGATVFDSIDCRETGDGDAAIFRLEDHMKRFLRSAEIIGMRVDYDLATLVDAVVDTVRKSGLKNCIIRPLALYSEVVMQVYPGDLAATVMIGIGVPHASPGNFSVMVGRMRKIDCMSMPAKAKVSGNYIGPMIAKTEAIAAGFDDALILDGDGNVAEGSTANVFIVENGKLVTAPDDGILPGITRDTVMKIAEANDIGIVRGHFTPERMKAADEAFLCSSNSMIKPIVKVDDTVIADGEPGPVSMTMKNYYNAIIEGRESAFAHWLTYV